ncbi:hypothetical protein Efla_003201 [Eimeria flavescens]
MSRRWEVDGSLKEQRMFGRPHQPSAQDSLWRPKPIDTPTKELQHRELNAGQFQGRSSFAPSENILSESTAPSESFWPSPDSTPVDVPHECGSAGHQAGQRDEDVVEVHHLSPAPSSECNDDDPAAPSFLWLPPGVSTLSSTGNDSNDVSPLVQFLRRSKALRMSLTQTMELQQQSLQLLLLHPRIAPASLDAPCCWCSAAADPQQRQQQQQSCVVMLQIEMLQELLQQSSSQLQQQQEDFQRGDMLLYEEQQRELQHQETLSALLPHWQHQQNQTVAAAAAELRIRRSVLKHHYQQLEEALSLQQRLQQEARARWLVEAADEIRTSYPEASDVEVVKLLQPQGAAGLWGCELSDGLIGNQLREKRAKLLRLEESLRQLQHMTGLLQQQQQERQQQQQQVAAVLAHTEKLTAAACTDLLIAQKHRKQSIKHSLLAGAATDAQAVASKADESDNYVDKQAAIGRLQDAAWHA